MAGRVRLQVNVVQAAMDRLSSLFQRPKDRVVVSFSAGKDSGVVLELTIMAAAAANRLPVDVVMRDEEILMPGSFEYAERIAARPEVRFLWLIQNQPFLNIYNRRLPYVWAFDERLKPEEWVRLPPDFATYTDVQNIESISGTHLFPPPHPDGHVLNVLGIRASESNARMMGVHSAKGWELGGSSKWGQITFWPIYDWNDSDIWKFLADFKLDYNHAYDVMHKLGIPRQSLRIAPVTMSRAGYKSLVLSKKAWPEWFEKVCRRCPGVRQAVLFGQEVIQPTRRSDESWEDAFWRECVNEAPNWIAERARYAQSVYVRRHQKHSDEPFPQEMPCYKCAGGYSSWRQLTVTLYDGDAFSYHNMLPLVQPAFFRPELAGTQRGSWGKGKPKF